MVNLAFVVAIMSVVVGIVVVVDVGGGDLKLTIESLGNARKRSAPHHAETKTQHGARKLIMAAKEPGCKRSCPHTFGPAQLA